MLKIPKLKEHSFLVYGLGLSGCSVVDFPLVPVTTILLHLFLVKKNRSISVIIFFLNLMRCLFFTKLIPGDKTI